MKGNATPHLLYNDRDGIVTLLGVPPETLPGGYSYRQHGPQETQYGAFQYVWTVRVSVRQAFDIMHRLGDDLPELDEGPSLVVKFWHRPEHEQQEAA